MSIYCNPELEKRQREMRDRLAARASGENPRTTAVLNSFTTYTEEALCPYCKKNKANVSKGGKKYGHVTIAHVSET